MSVHGGPEIANSGLMMHYDTGNTTKSFLGKPTSNMVPAGGIDMTLITGYTNTTATRVTDTQSPNGYALESVALAGYANSARHWLGDSSLISPTTGSAFFSVYAKQTVGSTPIKPSTFTGTQWIALDPLDGGSVYLSREYRRFGVYSTYGTASSGPTMTVSMFQQQSPAIGETVRWHSPQMEISTIVTPFVVGTRSATQSIRDLTGTVTFDASTANFNSSGLVFDGTTGYMRPTAPVSYLSSSCIEFVFKTNSIPPSGKYKTLCGYSGNVGYSHGTTGLLYLASSGSIIGSVITYSQAYRTLTSTAMSTGVFYHICFNKNTTSGVMDLYVNGVFNATGTFTAADYGQWPTVGSYLGTTTFDIGNNANNNAGQGWDVNFLDGVIPVCKLYNRVLTASEIANNFAAIRGRFGI